MSGTYCADYIRITGLTRCYGSPYPHALERTSGSGERGRMPKIVSTHSFRGGTGKSNLTANVATNLACRGGRVGVVDTDVQSPGIHVPFGVEQDGLRYTLNHYLWGECSIEEAAIDVTPTLREQGASVVEPAALFLIP